MLLLRQEGDPLLPGEECDERETKVDDEEQDTRGFPERVAGGFLAGLGLVDAAYNGEDQRDEGEEGDGLEDFGGEGARFADGVVDSLQDAHEDV